MPPRLTWADLGGRRTGIWGVGVEGKAALRRLRAQGIEPVLVDDRSDADLPDGTEVLPTGSGGLDALASCEVVIAGPGFSRYRADLRSLQERGVAVVGALALWLEEAPRERVVCVTGTKGKSTTVAILGTLLQGLGYRCFTGGNLGRPPFDPDAPDDPDFWVVEVSSFQCVSLTCAPPVLAVTSLYPDHLDWHGDEETYFADKLSICRRPGAELTIVNGEDDRLAQRRALLGPLVRWIAPSEEVPEWMQALGLPGRHNRTNAGIAQACLAALGVPGGQDPAALLRAAQSFQALDSRLRSVGKAGGVDFVDDSLSTNAHSTLAALSAIEDRRVALLVGGLDRGIDYRPLADRLLKVRQPVLVLTLPQNGARIGQALAGAALPPHVEVRACADLAEAVRAGFEWARPSGVVLLSPAAASFGRFRDYHDRAEQFLAAARSLGAQPV